MIIRRYGLIVSDEYENTYFLHFVIFNILQILARLDARTVGSVSDTICAHAPMGLAVRIAGTRLVRSTVKTVAFAQCPITNANVVTGSTAHDATKSESYYIKGFKDHTFWNNKQNS